MSDSSATLCAYVVSLALMLGYRFHIALKYRRHQKAVAHNETSDQVVPMNSVVCELKPNSRIRIS